MVGSNLQLYFVSLCLDLDLDLEEGLPLGIASSNGYTMTKSRMKIYGCDTRQNSFRCRFTKKATSLILIRIKEFGIGKGYVKLYTPKVPGLCPLVDFANEIRQLTREKRKKEGIKSPNFASEVYINLQIRTQHA